MDELRPCPFCGSTKASMATYRDVDGSPLYRVVCGMCQACGSELSDAMDAIHDWNTRPAEDAPQDDWLRAARMEALEAEVRRLQAVEARYWPTDTLRANHARLNMDAMRMDELRPCPFCGHHVGISPHPAYGEYRVRCADCGIVIADASDVAVTDAWNTRPAEDALTAQLAASQSEYEALHANFITLGMANEVYKNELREENTRLREVLGEFVAGDAAGHIEHEDGYMGCQYCDGQGTYDWTTKTYTYAHTAGCPVAVARALLTPPAALEADTAAHDAGSA